MIIGIIGKKRVGKDTSADYLVDKYGFVKYSFGDPVKQICQNIFDLTDEQLNTDKKDIIDEYLGVSPRQIFQIIGTDIFQYKIYNFFPELEKNIPKKQFWVKKFEKWYQNETKENKNIKIVISDIRFKHEYECLKNLGATLIKIEKDTKLVDDHISENELNDVSNLDYYLENNTTKENLYLKLDNIVKNIV